MRRVPFIATVLALLIVGVAAAQGYPGQPVPQKPIVYLPAVQAAPPSLTPEPAPADPAAIVLHISEVPSGYSTDDDYTVTNEDAAKNYDDPKAALKAFKEQGREIAYFRSFEHQSIFNPATRFAEQVTRYVTPEGALAGDDFYIKRVEKEGGKAISFPDLDGRTRAYRQTIKDGKNTIYLYVIAVTRGRFSMTIQVQCFDFEADVKVVESRARLASKKLVRFVPNP